MTTLSNIIRSFGLLFFIMVITSCGSTRPGQVFQWQAQGSHVPLNYEEIIAQDPLGPHDALKVYNLGKSAHASYHLVQIRTQEPLHLHRKHEATAVLLRGKGVLRVGKDAVTVKAGDVASIPSNTIHAYINESREPSLVYVMFAPPYEGKDRIVVKVTEPMLE